MSRRGHPGANTVQTLQGCSHFVPTTTGTPSRAVFDLSPALFPRCSTLADNFMLFRFVDMKFTPTNWLVTAPVDPHTLAYSVDATNANPTTFVQQLEIVPNISWSPSSTQNNGPSLRLKRRDLKGIVPWYRTIAGSPDDQLEYQGRLYCMFAGSSGAGQVQFKVEWTIEFKDMVAIALTFTLPRALEEDGEESSTPTESVAVEAKRIPSCQAREIARPPGLTRPGGVSARKSN